MIITWLTGGLGNQMFQYAAGLALAERRRTVLKLDASWYREDPRYEAHNRYALSCFNITEQFATREECDRLKGVQLTRVERLSRAAARRLRFYRYARSEAREGLLHSDPGFRFDPRFHDLPDGTYLHGMWQSERFFSPVADLLRLHFSFRYPAPSAVAAMAERIGNAGSSASVHFRRGDYVRNAAFNTQIGLLGLDYYRRALELLRHREPGATLFVFSDDIEWAEREFRPDGNVVYVKCVEHWHSYDKIRLMALCRHAIISNSTFAWWGAWLNPDKGRLVVAPDPWLQGKPGESRDVVPEGWRRLAAL